MCVTEHEMHGGNFRHVPVWQIRVECFAVAEHLVHCSNFRRVPCRYILFLPLSNVVQKIKIVNKKSFDEKISTIKQSITSIECSCVFKQVWHVCHSGRVPILDRTVLGNGCFLIGQPSINHVLNGGACNVTVATETDHGIRIGTLGTRSSSVERSNIWGWQHVRTRIATTVSSIAVLKSIQAQPFVATNRTIKRWILKHLAHAGGGIYIPFWHVGIEYGRCKHVVKLFYLPRTPFGNILQLKDRNQISCAILRDT